MVAEVTITVKNEEKKLTTNHLIYDPIYASDEDPILRELIKDTIKQFADEVEKVQLKIVIEVQ